jgi:hypothetical protein
MRKQLAFLVVFLLIFLSTAGCIDIHFVKDLLVPREEEKIEYWIKEYNFGHSFNSTQNDPIEIYNNVSTVPVKPLTEHMRFDIDVVMRSAEEIWETINESGLPIPQEFKDWVEQILELVGQRYIEVTIKSPDGVEWFNYKFNDTEKIEFPPETPLPGPGEGDWTIEVEGAGGGIEVFGFAYYDKFSIHVVLNEPKD